jgi:hypothetical protein
MMNCGTCGHVHDTATCPARTGVPAMEVRMMRTGARLIDATPADYIEAQVAQITEHDTGYDRQAALHLEYTSLAQVIADDIADGCDAWPATVAKYVYARDAYRACVTAREATR